MPDAILEVMARAIVEPLQAGMAGAAEAVTASTAEMNAAFTEAAAVAAGSSAETTVAFTKAAAVVKETQAKEAAAVKEATTSMLGDLGRLRERLTLTGQGFRIAGYEAGSAFGGLGALLAVPMLGMYFDKLKNIEIELVHTAEAAQMSVKDLTEWHDVLKESGIVTEQFDKMLPRLQEHMMMAASGSKEEALAFQMLGVNTDNWAKKLPDTNTVLTELAERLHEGKIGAEEVGAAYLLLGRGSAPLISFLAQVGGSLDEAKDKFSAHGIEAEASVKAAQDFQRAEAELSAEIDTIALPALQSLANVLGDIEKSLKGDAVAMVDLEGKILRFIPLTNLIGQMWEKFTHADVRELAAGFSTAEAAAAAMGGGIGKAQKSIEELLAEWEKLHKKGERPHVIEGWKEELSQMADAENEFHILSLAKQKEFWEAKLALTKKGSEEQRAVQGEIRTLDREIGRQKLEEAVAESETRIKALEKDSAERIAIERQTAELIKRIYGEDSLEYQRAQEKVLEVTKAVQAAIVEETKKGDEQLKRMMQELQRVDDEKLRHALEIARLEEAGEKEKIDKNLAIGMISDQQLIKQKEALVNKTFDLEKKAIERRIAELDPLDPNYPATRQRLDDQLIELKLKRENEITALETKGAKDRRKIWDDSFKDFNRLFDEQVKGVARGTETIGRAFQNIWAGMLTKFEANLEKMVADWIEKHVFMALFKQTMDETMAATSLATSAAGSKKEVHGTAYEAAAHAFSSTAKIPIIGPFLAPAAAAAAFVAVEAFGASIPSAAAGMVVPAETRETLAILHSREMVLPAALTRGMTDLIASGGAGRAGPGAGEAKSSPAITINMGPVHAIDAKGVEAVLESQTRTMVKIIKRAMRDGALP